MKNVFYLSLLFAAVLFISSCKTYKGAPWEKPQAIPGRVQCELYDRGGEGISYHDSDSVNNGSGKLNPANGTFLNEFRMNEGVDISYTKTNGTDDNPYNDVMPEMNQLYVGWTEPGEWIRYTVDVAKAGKYKIGIMFTSNRGGGIEISTEKNLSTGILKIPATYKDQDTVAWRQWHHWNKIEFPGEIELEKGIQVIKLKTTENGSMNYDYLEFTPAD